MPGTDGQKPQRTTFRPPWVKDGPPPIPLPTTPWNLNSQKDSKDVVDNTQAFTKVTLNPKGGKNTDQSLKLAHSKVQENGGVETNSRPHLERQLHLEESKCHSEKTLPKSENTIGAATILRANLTPPPPPRPPPPPLSRTILKDIKPLTKKQQKTIEMLKSRPRKRPDWACMMKEVESGKKLRHVICNDRSAPLIERVITKVTADPEGDAHFVFDSEKLNVHNKLLKQIQEGVKLKSVKTNDRSKPVLEGLRKFRRQLTIEEQLQKAEHAPVDEVVPDEMDDIDAVRDDLQSTKQMLALELRNKEALERENKRLQAKILNLEVELERENSQKSVKQKKLQDQKLTDSLKREVEQARKDAERLEKNFANIAEEKDKAKNELEEMKRMYANLEKRMKAGMALGGCPSAKDIAKIASQKSMDRPEHDESETNDNDTSEEESEEDDPQIAEEKRQQKEIKQMKTKIKNFRDKTMNSKKDRQTLKEQIKQQLKLLKEEKKKYKYLQREVDKMAKLMGETEDDDDNYDNNEKNEEEDEKTESEEESESEDSEEDEYSDTDDEEIPLDKRKNKLQDIFLVLKKSLKKVYINYINILSVSI
ncbi:PREDICTED: FK506-binding protein 5 isoform X1 [Ceratosolen solmsi marchali]|uniref:FK506-binding protein 5 isoform X1 n=1 Tax=Ceratosolen solmsi marchali TaxID=326594 RepID=A0AAJ6YSW4_9HYME|nr:PREDICTED: FK506-binding protein 5 isoform X1 [Ceratosolen solmsi marchali]